MTVDERIVKFQRKATQVDSAALLTKILASFPEDRRDGILTSVRPLIRADVLTAYDDIHAEA